MSTDRETVQIPGFVAGTWTVDPNHSSVGFTIRHVMTKIRGKFETFEATIVTAENLVDSSLTAVVDMSSISTGSGQRDKHLRSGDFFDVETHPQMRFVSTGVRLLDEERAEIIGDLTIRGITKQVALDVEIIGFGKDSRGVMRAGFSATGEINRRDFGVSWNSVLEGGGFALADKVQINLEVSAALQD